MNAFTDTKEYFKLNTNNPWQDTPLENYYALNPAAKGNAAENIVENLLKSHGYDVQSRQNAGHDRIINGVKTEIKFGLATDRNYEYKTIFNHIGFKKDWDQIYFIVINGDGEIKDALFKRSNLPSILIRHQQGGNTSDNDDFMISGNNSALLLNDNTAEHLL